MANFEQHIQEKHINETSQNTILKVTKGPHDLSNGA